MAAGQSAVRGAVLINGAAGVALLAFMGQMQKGEVSTAMATWLPWPLACFVVGVLAAALATGGAYLAQSNYFDLAEEDFEKKSWRATNTNDCPSSSWSLLI
jgi:hypothetical protein